MNLCLLAAVCEQHGHEAEIIDAEALRISNNELARRAVESKPDIIGLTSYSPFSHLVADIAKDIKAINPDMPVMVGGPDITIRKETALLPQFDYLFKGESERALPLFLEAYKNFGAFPPGIIYRKRGEVIDTGEPMWVAADSMKKSDMSGKHPLDGLPLPARHLLPMEKYRLGTLNGRQHFTSLQTARGCPWT